ncbi:hypothetical protein ACOSZA_13915 [Mammaliicoccus sciuri]|uniref:hypothetical protein n=1 Tax=Mammaliicoccus TaxID=2803850 RepID=UPI00195239E0|nr:hypothetical protein [Mammaliicoccus sciuri]
MKKLSFVLLAMLVIVLSACADNTKKNEGSKKEENKLLETTKNKEADEIAQKVLDDNLRLNTKGMVEYFNDDAVIDLCDAHYENEGNNCNRKVIENDSDVEFDPTGEYQTILGQYNKDKVSYVASYDGDYDQMNEEDINQQFSNKVDTNLKILEFEIKKENGKYKVSRYYTWDSPKEVLKKYNNKDNVYELKGNYSDLFEE